MLPEHRETNGETEEPMNDMQLQPVYLRALEEDDVERTHRWHNDADLYASLVAPFRCVSRQAELDWIRAKIAYSKTEVSLAICRAEDDVHIGNAYLTSIDWISRNGQLGIFIGDAGEQSRGYGSSAVQQLLHHAFMDLGLYRVYLDVISDNARAIRVYEKCGFVTEGRLRGHLFKQGEFKDVVMMGITADEWESAAAVPRGDDGRD